MIGFTFIKTRQQGGGLKGKGPLVRISILLLFSVLIILPRCTTEFIPDTSANRERLVVDGMITDQNRANIVKLTRSVPVGSPLITGKVKGAEVTITDGSGNVSTLTEIKDGIYATDSLTFRGRTHEKYALTVRVSGKVYESGFVEMKPVPAISSLSYKKVALNNPDDRNRLAEGCKISLDSYDSSGECRYYRWDYSETWEYVIPYPVVNRVCWITNKSDRIILKDTSPFTESRVTEFPLIFIDNTTEKLKVKYSVLVNQYSLNKEEYDFWETVSRMSQDVGTLYDRTPSEIKGNVHCVSNPDEVVYGYFSVSAVATKRLFVSDKFMGQPTFYSYCATDTLYGTLPAEGLNTTYWVIEDQSNEVPSWWVVTEYRECADCTTEGSKIKPDFWDDDLKDKR